MKKSIPTIYDVAKTAGISISTVSRYFNHPDQVQYQTRQKIESAVSALQFDKRKYGGIDTPDHEIKKTKDFLLCLPTMSNPFYGDLVNGAMAAAADLGCNLFVNVYQITSLNIDSFLHLVRSHDFSGIILLSAIENSLLCQIRNLRPVIQCSEYNETNYDISIVSIDDQSAITKAAEFLLSTGHRNLAFLSSSMKYHYAVRRYAGFEAALHASGIEVDPNWCIQLPHIDFGIAYNKSLDLLQQEYRPDGIITVSDVYAAACIKAAATLNIRVPEELSIIGFDNIDISTSTNPQLTTINQPRYQLGYTAFEVLFYEVENPSTLRQHLFLPSELIIRESTASK